MTALLSWLRKAPQPAWLKVGREKIEVPGGRKKWATVVETITTIANAGDRITAYSEEDRVLRSMAYVAEGDEAADQGDGASPATVQLPEGSSELAQLASIITQSNDAAVQRLAQMQESTMRTMEGLVQSFAGAMSDAINAHMAQAQLTAELQAQLLLVQAERDQLAQGGGGGDDFAGAMVRQFMGARAMGAGTAAPAANGKANGHKKEA